MAQNPAMMDKWQDAIYQSGKVAQVPHVSWWQIGGLPLAMTETPIGEHCHVLIEHTCGLDVCILYWKHTCNSYQRYVGIIKTFVVPFTSSRIMPSFCW